MLILAGAVAAWSAERPADMPVHPAEPGMGASYAWSLLGSALPMGLGMAWLFSPAKDLTGGLVLLTAGTVAGPSLGQFYAGSKLQGSIGMAARGAGVGLLAWGIGLGLEWSSCQHMVNMGDELECGDGGGLQVLLGSLLIGGGLFYSLIDTGLSVDRARARKASLREPKLTFHPWLAPVGTDRLLAGGRAQLRF